MGRKKDYSWQRGNGEGNHMFALYPTGVTTSSGHPIWRFRCDCGNIRDLTADQVFRSTRSVMSCGKCRPHTRDYSWQRGEGENNHLFALWPTGEHTTCRNAIWMFRCDCGVLKALPATYVFRANRPVSSCGCLKYEQNFGGKNKLQMEIVERRKSEHLVACKRTDVLKDQGYLNRSIYVDGKLVKRVTLNAG